MLEQPNLQVNPIGIRAYLQKQEDKIMLSADKSQDILK
jgi:hypothetical protein